MWMGSGQRRTSVSHEASLWRMGDLRYTWASWYVQRGTPLQVLKKLDGEERLETVQRDANLNADHLASWVAPHTGATALQLAAGWLYFHCTEK